jgi:uncharacterized iron-regulated membrane protein
VVNRDSKSAWQRWVSFPQQLWLRRAVFQVHLWSGVILGLYVFFISVTGSVLVYRNELYVLATPEQSHSGDVSSPQSDDATGSASLVGIQMVSTLIELHADLLGGPVGRRVNGIGAFAVLLSALTGLVIWWPGIRRWRRSLVLRRCVGWKRLTWDLHSAIGFWTVGFTVVFAVSGLYLSFPTTFHALVDRLYSAELPSSRPRFFDDALAWLAYSHFGRINGIGLPCSGPGVCDQATKAVWATFGLAPAVMFVTGMIMWWNHVVRRWLRSSTRVTGDSSDDP